MGSLLWQARLSAREIARSPAFTALTVVTLAVGIGAVTAVYATLDRVVLRPLPYPEADRLVSLRSLAAGSGGDVEWGLSQGGYFYFAEASRTLEAIGLADDLWIDVEVTLSAAEGAVRVEADSVTASVFDVLGARPALGRLFDERDDRPGAPPVIVLSHEVWTASFGADPTIVGRMIDVDGARREVIGVMEPGFRLPGQEPGAFVPLRLDPANDPTNDHYLSGLARLAPGSTLEDARAELDALTARFPEVMPDAYDDEFMREFAFRTEVEGLQDRVLGGVARVLWTLVAGAGLVFAIALANVANLFLLRTEVRRGELAVRTAHGASRWRLARDGWVDAVVVSGAAVLLALPLASFVLELLTRVAPGAIPRVDEIGMGWAAAGLAAALGLLAAAIIGPLPSLLARVDLSMLREGGQGQTTSGSRLALRRGLVGAQVAIALTLLASAGLMIRSLDRLYRQDTGFDRENLLAFQVALPAVRYGTPEASARFYRELLARLEALPDVAAAGGTTALPYRRQDGCWTTHSDDRTAVGDAPDCVAVIAVTPGYVEALGMTVAGRSAGWADAEAGTADAVVTRALADRFWPGEDPLGKTIRGFAWGDAPRYRVAGVAADIRAEGVDGKPIEAVFLPILPLPGTPLHWGPFWGAERELHLVVRSATGSPEALSPAVRDVLTDMDPGIAPGAFETMTSLVARSESLARTSLLMNLLGASALLALFLSAVGLYGVVSYFVRERTREIGLRMALGGKARVVAGAVLRQAMVTAVLGVAVGVAGTVVATRMLRSLLFGVHPNDPLTLAAAALVLLAVTAAAAWIPAARAARIDPVVALRE